MATHVELLTGLVNVAIPEVYQKGMSYYEVLTAVVNKVNELIEKSNEYFSEPVKQVMASILIEWKNNGELDDIIAVALGNQVTDLAGVGRTDETVIGNASALSSHAGITEIHRNIFISDTPPTLGVGEDGDIFIVRDNVSGVFTPQILIGGDPTGVTHIDPTVGEYYRLGNMVFVSMTIVFTYSGSSTADVTITGLPLTIRDAGDKPALSVTQIRNITFPTNAKYLLAYPYPDLVNGMEISFVVDGVSTVKLTGANISKAFQNFIRIQGFYYTA